MTRAANQRTAGLSWLSIIRLGFVQAAIGSVVVLTTSTLNRVMVVELSLAAVIPGLLVGLHYAVQMARPLWGHSSDNGGKRTLFIIGGMAMLAVGGIGAASSTLGFEANFWLGLAMAVVSFIVIGFGIGASGTSLLALLASRTAPTRRPAAATLVWMLMIAGIVATAIISSIFLQPYSHERLITLTAISGALATVIAALAVWGVERKSTPIKVDAAPAPQTPFREALIAIWHDRQARIFTFFVFFSMLAYQTQDLILEPFGGFLFGMSPAETTRLSGSQHGGVLLGMAVVGLAGTLLSKRFPKILKIFTVSGCLASAAALMALAYGASVAPAWPLEANVFALGFANGIFAVAAIGTMMALAGDGESGREGIRMGVWGAAQAIAFGLGGFLGTVAIDLMRWSTGDIALSFATVFTGEAIIFIVSAAIAVATTQPQNSAADTHPSQPTVQPAE